MNLMGNITFDMFDSQVAIQYPKMETFGQVDKTAKKGVSIYWGKCGGADKSSGAQINPFSSFNFLPQPPQSKTSGQRGLPILRWAIAKEAGGWVATENEDDDEQNDSNEHSDDSKNVD